MTASVHPFEPRREPSGDAATDPHLERRLSSALADLPRERAGEEFTGQVLGRIDEAHGARRRWRGLAAAAALFAVAGVGAREWNERLERQAAAERIASLRAEYSLLQEELENLQQSAEAQRPVVFLGGNEDVEYVVDLSRLTPGPRLAATGPATAPDGVPRSGAGGAL